MRKDGGQVEDEGIADMYKHFLNIDEEKQEFRRLCAEPCMKTPNPGDRVIVAAGFVGLGHPWIREEAECLEVGDTSVHVRFVDYHPYRGEKGSLHKWVHHALITDVLSKPAASN
jgi:hypothetical protein